MQPQATMHLANMKQVPVLGFVSGAFVKPSPSSTTDNLRSSWENTLSSGKTHSCPGETRNTV
eukprot:9953281-Lingulodinium_polyedra.AAC.1